MPDLHSQLVKRCCVVINHKISSCKALFSGCLGGNDIFSHGLRPAAALHDTANLRSDLAINHQYFVKLLSPAAGLNQQWNVKYQQSAARLLSSFGLPGYLSADQRVNDALKALPCA